jgi:hypothetical protein
MSNSIDQLFAGMAKAEIFGKGSYFDAGIYRVKLKTFHVKEGGFNGNSFISEFEIVESNNPGSPAGSTRSFVMNFTNKYIMADVSMLVLALLGHDPAKKENQQNAELRETVAKYTRAALGSETAKKELGAEYEEGMFLGVELKLECTIVPTKPSAKNLNGGTFTTHAWSPIAEPAV